MPEAIVWQAGALLLLDQRRLPREEIVLRCETVEAVAAAIRDMVVRGAPAIGVTAAYGVALGARAARSDDPAEFSKRLRADIETLRATRPTAVNLFWALERMRETVEKALPKGVRAARAAAEAEAVRIHEEDVARNRAIGRFGAPLIPDGARVLTHCNAGALATGGYGTALGVIRAASEAGRRLTVWVDETRPYLQGARLTAWELGRLGVPATLITDSMAAHFMARGEVDCVIVGADRIAANGDTANKIGTYGLAVLAHAHGIPFFVAAPVSTVDLETPTGAEIPIEERPVAEVLEIFGVPIAPEGQRAANPSFDVTPARLISAIVTDRGVARAPYEESLGRLAADAEGGA